MNISVDTEPANRPVEYLLEATGIAAGYGRVPILHGIDIRVASGEIVGVLGHNGMGKTTLLKTLMGLVKTTSGSIYFDAVDITREPAHRRSRMGIGYVPQGRGIFPGLSVFDNIRMGIAAHSSDEQGAIEQILDEFPRLKSLTAREGGALSGGEQQILAIARCLIGEPELILLDEPTEGIQPSIIDDIMETLDRLKSTKSLSIVLVEQNLDFIQQLSDRIMLLQKGAITREVAGDAQQEQLLLQEFAGFGSTTVPAEITPPPVPAQHQTASDTSNPRESTGGESNSVSIRPESRSYSVSSQLPLPAGDHVAQSVSYEGRLMSVRRPTHAQLQDIVADLNMHMSDQRVAEFLEVMDGTIAHRRLPTERRGKSIQRLVHQDRNQGGTTGTSARSHGSTER